MSSFSVSFGFFVLFVLFVLFLPTSEGIVSARSDWKVWSSFRSFYLCPHRSWSFFKPRSSFRVDSILISPRVVGEGLGHYVAKFGGQVEFDDSLR